MKPHIFTLFGKGSPVSPELFHFQSYCFLSSGRREQVTENRSLGWSTFDSFSLGYKARSKYALLTYLYIQKQKHLKLGKRNIFKVCQTPYMFVF